MLLSKLLKAWAISGDVILNWVVALGLGAVLVETVRAIVNRRKLGADYADVISKAAVGLLEPLQERIKELEEQVEVLEIKLYSANTALEAAKDDLAIATTELTVAKSDLEQCRTTIAKQSEEIAVLRAQEVAQAEKRHSE